MASGTSRNWDNHKRLQRLHRQLQKLGSGSEDSTVGGQGAHSSGTPHTGQRTLGAAALAPNRSSMFPPMQNTNTDMAGVPDPIALGNLLVAAEQLIRHLSDWARAYQLAVPNHLSTPENEVRQAQQRLVSAMDLQVKIEESLVADQAETRLWAFRANHKMAKSEAGKAAASLRQAELRQQEVQSRLNKLREGHAAFQAAAVTFGGKQLASLLQSMRLDANIAALPSGDIGITVTAVVRRRPDGEVLRVAELVLSRRLEMGEPHFSSALQPYQKSARSR